MARMNVKLSGCYWEYLFVGFGKFVCLFGPSAVLCGGCKL